MPTPSSRAANETQDRSRRAGNQPGANADSPAEIPPPGWWEITKRVLKSLGSDHVSLVAGGVAFFAFLAIFPALSALSAIYGLMVSPDQVASQVGQLASVLPAQAEELLNERLVDLTTT